MSTRGSGPRDGRELPTSAGVVTRDVAQAAAMPAGVPPDKLFFRIGEVSELVGVKPHMLRAWEDEFGVLKPMKTRGSHRQFRRRDVELALVIKHLLQQEGFTIAGARKRLREMGHLGPAQEPGGTAATALDRRGDLLALRAELQALLDRVTTESPSSKPFAAMGGMPSALRGRGAGPWRTRD